MKLFLDCEFTDFQGDLISLALVDENEEEFYCVIPFNNPSDWVAQHVLPFLNQFPEQMEYAQKRLALWLQKYDEVEIITDWPEDISFFCNFLITNPGTRINTPSLTFRIVREINSAQSKVPHNALEDAKAIKESYDKLTKKD